MKRQLKNGLILGCMLSFQFSFGQEIFTTTHFNPYADQVLKLHPDFTYFTKSDLSANKGYPAFKRANLVKISGFSHCSGNELRNIDPKDRTNSLFLLTDNLAIVNTQICPPNKVDLPAKEIDAFLSIFSNKAFFEKMVGGGSNCFFPRHTFLFYDKNDKVIGYIEVCFQCSMSLTSNNLKKIYEGNLTSSGETKLKELCRRNGIAIPVFSLR